MNIDISNTELKSWSRFLKKRCCELEKEIHRTDALTYKQELQQKAAMLNELRAKLQQVKG
jgi:hypothetical protein